MLKRVITGAALTGVASAAAVLGASGAAHAANSTVSVYLDGTRRGHMTHIDDGDLFNVWDDAIDGHGTRGQLFASGREVKEVYVGGGGSYEQFGYDIKAGVMYSMVVCIVDGASDTTPIDCTSKVLEE